MSEKDQLIEVLRLENSTLQAELARLRKQVADLESKQVEALTAESIQGINALSANLRNLEKRLAQSSGKV